MLLDELTGYRPGRLPMHMPGHKRNVHLADYLKALRADLDITEIDGFDDLHAPSGTLLRGMRRAARLWGADESRFLVNGATCGLLAAVYALAANGGRAVVARNCHKSVYHALELTGVEPVFVMPDVDAQTGACGRIAPEDVRRALEEAPDARFVLVTSPTYEGVMSDIAAICRAAHEWGVPVIVDEAHGAHLGILDEAFPADAMRMGADLSVKSVHKTLPSLTQTAILLVRRGIVDMAALDHALDIFETSSPSYLLMASIDGCVSLMESRGAEILRGWRQALEEFHEGAASLAHLRVCRQDEPSKLVIDTSRAGISGFELMRRLREENVELEMASLRYAVAMTGAGDTRETLCEFLNALRAADQGLSASEVSAPLPTLPRPARVLSPKAALRAPSESVSARQAVGRVSASYAWAYPPGIPMLVPGERVPEGFAELWGEWEKAGARLVTTHDSLRVVCEPEINAVRAPSVPCGHFAEISGSGKMHFVREK